MSCAATADAIVRVDRKRREKRGRRVTVETPSGEKGGVQSRQT